MFRLTAALLAGIVLAAAPAQAQSAKTLGKFGNWSAYEFTENGSKVCYMAAQPAKAEGNYSKRGDVFLLVTHRPAEGSKNVLSYMAGYSYRSGSTPKLKVDGQEFGLFTQGETAWAPDAATDEKISAAIRKGSSLVVNGVSARGTETKDTYSLKGSGAAHDAINKACGL